MRLAAGVQALGVEKKCLGFFLVEREVVLAAAPIDEVDPCGVHAELGGLAGHGIKVPRGAGRTRAALVVEGGWCGDGTREKGLKMRCFGTPRLGLEPRT